MRNIWGYLLIEWKLLFRGSAFWIACALCGGLFYLFSMDKPYKNNLGQNAMDQSMFLMLVFLLGLLLAMHAARRDYTTRSHLVFGALPVRLWQLHAARIAGLALPFTVLALIPAALFMASVIREGIPFVEAGRGILALATSIVPVWLTVVIGYAVGSLSNRRWIYIVGIAGFLSATYLLQLILLKQFTANWLQLLDFTQLDFFVGQLYSLQWGFMQDAAFWLHRLSHTGVLLTVFCLLVLLGMRRRKERKSIAVVYGVIGAAVVLTTISVYAYMQISLGRMAIIREELDFYRPSYEQIYYTVEGQEIVSETRQRERERTAKFAGLTAERYDLTVTLGSKHELDVEASLHMRNGTGDAIEAFPVTLRHLYHIDSVKVNGADAVFDWEPGRDYVWVKPQQFKLEAGAAVVLDVTYSGHVEDWRYEPGFSYGQYLRASFVDEDRILLPGTSGWLPMPGIYTLTGYEKRYFGTSSGGTREAESLMDYKFALPEADYKVKVVSERPLNMIPAVGLIVSSGWVGEKYETLLEANRTTGFTLVAGPLRMITSRSDNLALSLVIDRLWTGGNVEQSLASLTGYTEQALKLLNELWPELETGAHPNAFPQEITLMSDDRRNSVGAGPMEQLQPAVMNADGMIYLPMSESLIYNLTYFKTIWTGKLVEHHFGKYLFRTHDFIQMLTAYAAAHSISDKEEALSVFEDHLGGVMGRGYDWEFIEIFSELTEEEFKLFIKDYYALISDESISYTEYQEQEREFLASRSGVRR